MFILSHALKRATPGLRAAAPHPTEPRVPPERPPQAVPCSPPWAEHRWEPQADKGEWGGLWYGLCLGLRSFHASSCFSLRASNAVLEGRTPCSPSHVPPKPRLLMAARRCVGLQTRPALPAGCWWSCRGSLLCSKREIPTICRARGEQKVNLQSVAALQQPSCGAALLSRVALLGISQSVRCAGGGSCTHSWDGALSLQRPQHSAAGAQDGFQLSDVKGTSSPEPAGSSGSQCDSSAEQNVVFLLRTD